MARKSVSEVEVESVMTQDLMMQVGAMSSRVMWRTTSHRMMSELIWRVESSFQSQFQVITSQESDWTGTSETLTDGSTAVGFWTKVFVTLLDWF